MSDLSRALAQKEARREMVAKAGKDGKSPLDSKIMKKAMAKALAEEKAKQEVIVKEARKIKVALRKKPKKVKRACPRKPCPKPILKECRNNVAFVLPDGRKLKNVVHLIDELETMPDEVFYSYVNEFKNDFSNWLRDILKEDAVADELQLVNNRLDAQRTLLKHVVRKFIEAKK